MEITATTKLQDLVSNDYRLAPVLSSFGFDYCCHGKMSLGDACEQKKVSIDAVKQAIVKVESFASSGSFVVRPNDWSVSFLIDFIVANHHQYLYSAFPLLKSGLSKLVGVHGSRHPELIEIDALFNEMTDALLQHLWKEENILFPYGKSLDGGSSGFQQRVPFGSVEAPISMMQGDHEREGSRLFRLRELTNGYSVPSDGCNTYRVVFSQLSEFDSDLIQHIHLENNILFPRLIKLEQGSN